ncbi:hypothetical protein RchiOBHm_Chr7g0213561 [Rosa chinensis]|uniref:Uncharacterized protein n=1 Tax=Rosa chinensis TaxID=74649 RepID=A0A2P6PB18_ROSCH|nr:hypothetical protein RchiOBHm_Chr7g0213561 [Rosa chinensis]
MPFCLNPNTSTDSSNLVLDLRCHLAEVDKNRKRFWSSRDAAEEGEDEEKGGELKNKSGDIYFCSIMYFCLYIYWERYWHSSPSPCLYHFSNILRFLLINYYYWLFFKYHYYGLIFITTVI